MEHWPSAFWGFELIAGSPAFTAMVWFGFGLGALGTRIDRGDMRSSTHNNRKTATTTTKKKKSSLRADDAHSSS